MANTAAVRTVPGMARNYRAGLYDTGGETSYWEVYQSAQGQIVKAAGGKDIAKLSEESLKDIILKHIINSRVKCSLTSDPAELANYLYHDMARWSFITREGLLDLPGFEELNINSYNDVDIVVNGVRKKTDYAFQTPEHAYDIHRRMLQSKNVTFDATNPWVTAELRRNIRITATKAPINDEEVNVSSSIRNVATNSIELTDVVGTTLTEDMYNFLYTCMMNGVSVCFGGETGSGKTTVAGILLRKLAETQRIVTIEEGSREWDLIIRDENGKVVNSIVHWKTVPNDDPKLAVTQNHLVQLSLRFDPDFVAVGEMRSDEAYIATEASQTGHGVLTTTHSISAVDSPTRLLGLCKKLYDFDDATLMTMIARAWPIQIYCEKMPDNKRRVTEIVEILRYKNGELEYNTLYEYEITKSIKTPSGRLIEGRFVRRNGISKALHQRLLKKGATDEELERFI